MKDKAFIAVPFAALLLLSPALAAETVPSASVLMEAEQGALLGSKSFDDPGASGGKAVGWMGSARFEHAPAANCLRLRYAWNAPAFASITVNDRPPRSVVLMGGDKLSGVYLERLIWIVMNQRNVNDTI